MIRVKKTKCQGFYVFQGKSSANSLFIEDLREAKQFLILANYYLKGYLKIYEYLLSPDGWIMIVKINNFDEIRSRHDLEGIDEGEIWRIISERMRIFLSRFVKFTNRKQGRTGSKVHSVYERYIFQTLTEAMQCIAAVRKRLVKMYQSKRKYRSKKSHFRVPKKLGKGSIFLSSAGKRKKFREVGIGLECYILREISLDIASKFVNNTRKLHETNFSSKLTPFQLE